ncbi:unnamed protein product [Brachionus calyciflorus]|uniref:Uncharacterized protein n=1 Tax=Brachionus calyciflorus TaxID=104777 RepID=A0A813PRS8_9BILA|nr:unnamed protein product [Brachionus calyciflorus]
MSLSRCFWNRGYDKCDTNSSIGVGMAQWCITARGFVEVSVSLEENCPTYFYDNGRSHWLVEKVRTTPLNGQQMVYGRENFESCWVLKEPRPKVAAQADKNSPILKQVNREPFKVAADQISPFN